MSMILTKLKEGTRPQHEDLENTVDVLNQMFSLENYKTLVGKFYRFYSGIEPELARLDWSETGYDMKDRLKLPGLKKDLKQLGFTRNKIKNLAPFADLPPLDTLARGFGTIYVIEGATLGGQVINRHLKEHLGLTPSNGGLFFSGYGKNTGEMWNEFRKNITEFAEQYQNDEEIVSSAKATFSSFKRCIEEPLRQITTNGTGL